MTVNMVSGAVKGEKITSWKAIDWSPSFLRKAVTCEYFIMGESRAAHTDGGTGSFGVAQPEWARWAETLAFISLSSCVLSSAAEEVLYAKMHTSSYLQQYTYTLGWQYGLCGITISPQVQEKVLLLASKFTSE